MIVETDGSFALFAALISSDVIDNHQYQPLVHDVCGEIVDITSVQQEVAVHRVAEGRHVASQRHRGPDVSPETARVVHPHVGHRDVGGDGEVGQPQVLPGDV